MRERSGKKAVKNGMMMNKEVRKRERRRRNEGGARGRQENRGRRKENRRERASEGKMKEKSRWETRKICKKMEGGWGDERLRRRGRQQAVSESAAKCQNR